MSSMVKLMNGLPLGQQQAIIWTKATFWWMDNWEYKSKWNLKQNTTIFIHENDFQKVFWKLAAIFLSLHVLTKGSWYVFNTASSVLLHNVYFPRNLLWTPHMIFTGNYVYRVITINSTWQIDPIMTMLQITNSIQRCGARSWISGLLPWIVAACYAETLSLWYMPTLHWSLEEKSDPISVSCLDTAIYIPHSFLATFGDKLFFCTYSHLCNAGPRYISVT